MNGVLPGALHSKRMPVQMWAGMWKGWIAEVYLTEPEARNELLQWADRPNEATVEPLTIHFGHDSLEIRDAW